MPLSLITPTYNSAKTLTDTIESIVVQIEKYPEIAKELEYIIIDGASSDGTKEIIQKYQNKLPELNIKFISEPDKGIFDAMNKGIRMATGDIVGIINSDDFYYNTDALSKVIQAFKTDESIDAVYGDLMYVDNDNIKKQTRYWKAGEYKEENLNWGWSIPHPTFFVRRRVYEKLNKIFDTSLSIAADYELTFRLLKINKINVKYIREILVTMRDGGSSAKNIGQRIKGWKEQRLVWKINSIKIPPFFTTRRIINKLGQFLKLSR
jgi:glycosyltransferase